MRTIHHDAVVIPAYDETVYGYDELSADAKENALSNWEAKGENTRLFNFELDDIFRALGDFAKVVHIRWEEDAWHNVFIYRTDDTYDNLREVDHTGELYSMDICEAWNKHVGKLEELREAYDNATGFEEDNALSKLNREIGDAMLDVEQATKTLIEANWDWYIFNPKQAFEIGFAYDYEYDEDGDFYEG